MEACSVRPTLYPPQDHISHHQSFSPTVSGSVGSRYYNCVSRSWAWCSWSEPGILSPMYASSIFRLGNSRGCKNVQNIFLAMCSRWRRCPRDRQLGRGIRGQGTLPNEYPREPCGNLGHWASSFHQSPVLFLVHT